MKRNMIAKKKNMKMTMKWLVETACIFFFFFGRINRAFRMP